MIKTFSAAAALLLAVPALAQVQAWQKLEGQDSGITETRAVAVSDAAAWEKVWKEHSAATQAPAVDFAKETVVAVFLGERRTAGSKIEIVVQDDAIDSNRLNVFYKEVRQAAKPFAAMRVTYPFAMVKVRKAATVSFEVNGKMSIPENAHAPANPRDAAKARALADSLQVPDWNGLPCP